MGENVAANLITPAAEEIGKNIVALIKRQLNYLCCFSCNIKDLQKESKKLEDTRGGLQKQVDEEANNARQILPAVDTWLKDAIEFQTNARQILGESSEVKSGCFSLGSRYSLSRKALKEIEAIKEHLQDIPNQDVIAVSAPPAARVPLPKPQGVEFSSRKQIEEGVIRAIKDEKAKLIGICGMGGVGKTTLAKKIQYTMKDEMGLFEETVMVVVSQNVNLTKIQLEIADWLGLKEIKDIKESDQARATLLRVRLRDSKRKLIILDDIWGKVNLDDFGIPCESDFKGCTVLLTSRNIEVLNGMGSKNFGMEILPLEESWSLFQKEAGECVNHSDLMSIAADVVKECNGLPLAIKTVGNALKDKEKRIWEHAHHRLKSGNPRNMPTVLEEVYKPLSLSYDFLNDEDAKSLLLLCSQFPEDYNIRVNDLTLYSVGLNKLERVDDLTQARNGVVAAIDKLKNGFLLLKGEDRDTVKMHDVIRDVVGFIASEKGLVDIHHKPREHHTNQCEWILKFSKTSSEFLADLMVSNFPNLHLLSMQTTSWRASQFPFLDDFSFLEKMKELCVLSLKRISFESLPQVIEMLNNLRTLQLDQCSMSNISIVSKLSSLEILSCVKCENIDELPREIGELKHLRLLEFSHCRGLERIVPGVISNLTKLEELKMLDSFDGWESTRKNEKERWNATLKELQSLHKLVCLEIQIKNIGLLEEEIQLPSVQNYKIIFGKFVYEYKISKNILVVEELTKETINIQSWIHTLLKTTEMLYLKGEGSRNFLLSQIENTIELLQVKNCDKIEELFGNEEWKNRSRLKFPNLKTLRLKPLPNLITFGRGIESIEFPLLERVSIKGCPKLESIVCPNKEGKYNHLFNEKVKFDRLTKLLIGGCNNIRSLFTFSVVQNLVNLEWLRIINCNDMEQVIAIEKQDEVIEEASLKNENEEDGKTSHITFPKLETLELWTLSSITSFVKGIESIEFPVLRNFDIQDCPKLKSMVSNSSEDKRQRHGYDDDQSLHLFDKVKFHKLEELSIWGYDDVSNIWCQQIPPPFFQILTKLGIYYCDNIKSSFSSPIVENLVNLKSLCIDSCKHMEQVVAIDKETNENPILFQSLEKLELRNLPLLGMFGEWECALELPSLRSISIARCPKLNLSTRGAFSAPNLHEMKVDNQNFEEKELKGVDNLNSFLHQHIVSTRQQESTSSVELGEVEEEGEVGEVEKES